ncbi:Type i inositol polyphosphate 5-phosphatase, partial [Thalictrum thalictroides]
IPSEILRRARRRNSYTSRAQYINTKELRISVGTWNVGGKLPPDDLDIGDWLDVDDPADIYILGKRTHESCYETCKKMLSHDIGMISALPVVFFRYNCAIVRWLVSKYLVASQIRERAIEGLTMYL